MSKESPSAEQPQSIAEESALQTKLPSIFGSRNFDWNEIPSVEGSQEFQTFTRNLGPTEISYYLGSRGGGTENGVNDMYLHIGFKSLAHLVSKERVLLIWKELLNRHALLLSKVVFKDYDDIKFLYEYPKTEKVAMEKAENLLEFRTNQDPKVLLDEYLNGPRTLNDSNLSKLIISTPSSTFSSSSPTSITTLTSAKLSEEKDFDNEEEKKEEQEEQEFDFYLFCTHFLGDGMALHSTANEFFSLLSNDTEILHSTTTAITPSVEEVIEEKLSRRSDLESTEEILKRLPKPLEALLEVPIPSFSTFDKIARETQTSKEDEVKFWETSKLNYKEYESSLLGGQSFPPRLSSPSQPRLPRNTQVPTFAYSQSQTSKILKACKEHGGVSISNAVFSLCNFAWGRTRATFNTSPFSTSSSTEEDCMLYSALNIRPFLTTSKKDENEKKEKDWFHIAIGYYNIILPSTFSSRILSSPSQTESQTESQTQTSHEFWTQTLSTKSQTSQIVKSSELKTRVLLMALEREVRSIGWEKADDLKRAGGAEAGEKEQGGKEVRKEVLMEEVEEVEGEMKVEKKTTKKQVALMGVSMLGNLDGMYAHDKYQGITLHTLTTGSRQRPSSLLLFAYTFKGKLWFSLGYDKNGFEEGVVERWWIELEKGVEEFLLV